MNTSEILLVIGLAGVMILTQVGTHKFGLRRFLLPLGVTVFVAFQYLHSIPTAGGDLDFELILTIAGAALGALSALFIRVERDALGRLVTRAGIAYTTIWIAVFGGRLAFAWLATNSWRQQVGQFVYQHQITGAAAFTAAFVLMALAMVIARTAVIGLHALLVLRRSGTLTGLNGFGQRQAS